MSSVTELWSLESIAAPFGALTQGNFVLKENTRMTGLEMSMRLKTQGCRCRPVSKRRAAPEVLNG